MSIDNDDLSEEQITNLFKVSAPMVPVLLNQLAKVDETIVGGILICFRENGSIACMNGNSPPSVTVEVLKRVITELSGSDAQLVETAYADTRGKAN